MSARRGRGPDLLLLLLVIIGSTVLYVSTLAPTVVTVFDDSPEFQLVCHLLGVAHPTGYPLYTLLGKLFTLLPVGDLAYRVNLMSAIFAALAAGVVMLLVRELTGRLAAGFLSALALAVSPVFWSQATIAEVYPLHLFLMALILWLLARWDGAGQAGEKWIIALAAAFGLALTHHRTIVLLLPGVILVFVLARRAWPASHSESGMRPAAPARWWALLLALLLPLALYLYIPLLGASVGSLDGSYRNTVTGFLRHVLALDYGAFLSENPLTQSRDAASYFSLWKEQFGAAGIALGLVGLIWPWPRRRMWLAVLLSFAVSVLFALLYRVADVEVFLLPAFLLWAVAIGMTLGHVQNLGRLWPRSGSSREARVLLTLLVLAFAVQPVRLAVSAWPAMDRSADWGVYDSALDIMSQPLPEGATIIGILGEITVLRYLQEARSIRQDLQTIFADREPGRLAAVNAAVAERGEVYLTRSLRSIEGQYHIDSVGPLIRVRPKPPAGPAEACSGIDLGAGLCLETFATEVRQSHSASTVRIALHWLATRAPTGDARFSLRLVASDGRQLTQGDSRPVHEAYPTWAWGEGERVQDHHDLLLPPGTPYGHYGIEIVVYEPESGEELSRAALGTITLDRLAASSLLPAPDALQVDSRDNVVWGRSLRLMGHSVGGDEFAPGGAVPLQFLWRPAGRADDLAYAQVWLVSDHAPVERSFDLAYVNSRPEFEHQPLIRQWMDYQLPANLPDGQYDLLLGVLDGTEARNMAPTWLPWLKGPTDMKLGSISVKGRDRAFELPFTAHSVQVLMGESIELRGWELAPDDLQPGDTLELRLIWMARAELERAYSVFIHLTDQQSNIVAQQDCPPGAGTLPTTSWVTGEVVDDRHSLTLPPDLAAGSYDLRVGLYDPLTGRRLPPVGNASGLQPDHIILKEIIVP